MKKTLLTLGAAVALTLALASCGTKDCVCELEVLGQSTQIEVNEFDGNCDEVSFKDLDAKWQNGLSADEIKLNCKEK